LATQSASDFLALFMCENHICMRVVNTATARYHIILVVNWTSTI